MEMNLLRQMVACVLALFLAFNPSLSFALSELNTVPLGQGPSLPLIWTNVLPNMVLTGVAITPVAPTVCGATCTVTAAKAGSTILLNLAAGSIATLPAATGTGNAYNFVVSTTTTSAKDAILAASSSDAIIGTAMGWTGSTAKIFSGNASTYHSIQMPYTGTQPSGGFAGDQFTCTDIATNVWECNGAYEGGTTPTTPYSSGTS